MQGASLDAREAHGKLAPARARTPSAWDKELHFSQPCIMVSLGKWAVKLFLIFPIQAVLPTLACFSAWRLVLAVRGGSPARPRPRDVRGALLWVLARGLRQGGRFWSTLEVLFAVWYFVRRTQLEQSKISPIVPGTREERRALATRCLDAIDVG